MLDTQLKSQLKQYFQKLTGPVTLAVGAEGHPKKPELLQLLRDVAEQSDLLAVREDADGLRSGVSFRVLANSDDTGIVFSGVPGGHEFSSLILAILQAGGTAPKLSESIQALIRGMDEELVFETVVSLDCHNCPEVVQTLNSFALLGPRIRHEMIDGGLFPDLVAERKIQGVPAVYLNGLPFSNGKLDAGGLIEKLLAKTGGVRPAPQAGDQRREPYDVLIIGGGPSGVSSAVYSARKGLRVGLVADRIGGQVRDTMGIENLVAIFKTTGPELSQTLGEQLRVHGVDLFEHTRVQNVMDGDLKSIALNTGEILFAKTLIVSTGAKWRELNVPGEKEYIGSGVAYCPHCDGPFFKGKDVAVIGGGNSGVEAALDLAGIVRSVTLLEFGPRLNADRVLLDRLEAAPNIRSVTGAATKRIEAENGAVNALVYADRETEKEIRLPLHGVFIQIGLVPNTAFLGGLVATNRMGEIVVDEKCRTNVPGIFACGDVTTTPFKQIVIAMGEGAKASLAAFEYLLKQPVAVAEKIAS